MTLLRRLAPLAVGALATLGLAAGIGAPAGASGTPAYNEQAVLVLAEPAIPENGTNTATIKACQPGTEVPFVLRSWDQPGKGHGPDNGLGEGTLWLGTAVVGADGSATLTFTLPSWIRPGTFAVKAMCDLPHGYSGWLATKMLVTGSVGPDDGRSSRSAVEGAEVLSASASAGSSSGGSSSGGLSASASADPGRSPLARTGLDPTTIGRLGVALLALGGAAVLVARKRRLSVGL